MRQVPKHRIEVHRVQREPLPRRRATAELAPFRVEISGVQEKRVSIHVTRLGKKKEARGPRVQGPRLPSGEPPENSDTGVTLPPSEFGCKGGGTGGLPGRLRPRPKMPARNRSRAERPDRLRPRTASRVSRRGVVSIAINFPGPCTRHPGSAPSRSLRTPPGVHCRPRSRRAAETVWDLASRRTSRIPCSMTARRVVRSRAANTFACAASSSDISIVVFMTGNHGNRYGTRIIARRPASSREIGISRPERAAAGGCVSRRRGRRRSPRARRRRRGEGGGPDRSPSLRRRGW